MGGVLRIDVLCLRRLLDLSTHTDRLRRRWWRWRRLRQTTYDTTHDTTGDAPLDSGITIEVRVDRLRLDLLWHLDRRRVQVHYLNRFHFGRLGRWRRRGRWWRRWWSRHKRHHRWRCRQDVGRHQRDDDHRRDDSRFNEDRHPDRFALVVPELYRPGWRYQTCVHHVAPVFTLLEYPRSRAKQSGRL